LHELANSGIGGSMNKTALIGVDWGTTSMRLWRFSPSGQITERKRSDRGILKVADGNFREVLEAAIGIGAAPDVPILMSGMIGSRQGWVEAPYVFCPADIATLADHLRTAPGCANVQIVPGVAVREAGGRCDVMRGEETQILGAGLGSGPRLVVLPGTHCKWVLVENGCIRDFVTFMTGEMYQALRRHTILARLMPADDAGLEVEPVHRSFVAGLTAGLDGKEGLMQSLFSIRARGLFDELAPELAPAALSGLLIGAEISEGLVLARKWGLAEIAPLIVGGDVLIERYQTAFRQAGIATAAGNEDAGAAGLWQIARQRNLVS
jgi:2-dehydro-3-deoxygalactonokinase